MSTIGTLVSPSADNSSYIKSLIFCRDLSEWPNRRDWQEKKVRAKKSNVNIYKAEEVAAYRMADTAFQTVRQSNDQMEERTIKYKDSDFYNKEDLKYFILGLIFDQDGYCALSQVPLQYDPTYDDTEMLASLDRIDSNGHYTRSNLQIVCKFINRWKSNSNDGEFSRLLSAVRSVRL